jgi:dihydrolipoamide dehydrogenase
MMNRKLGIIILFGAAVAAFFIFDLHTLLNFETLKSQNEALKATVEAQFVVSALVFFVCYVLVTGMSLPGAAIMSLAAGALFGLWPAVVLVSFGSTFGATIAFLMSRTLLRDWVQTKFGSQLAPMNAGIEKEGGFYLFGLRLVPLFPFFVINLLMGLTPIKTLRFMWVSQLGMLPATIVFVNAGTQLGQLESVSGLLSPALILSFVVLGVFPLIAKKILNGMKANAVLRKYKKPKSFDTNLIVIGAGSAGLVSSLIAATVKAKVTLIEKHQMGGDCLNTGCVPSKALIRSAKASYTINNSEDYGIKANGEVDFAAVMSRVHNIIKTIEPHDSVERYTSLGVDCEQGEARIISPWEVEVNGRTISAPNIILASGARPLVPPFPGLDQVAYATSDNVWELTELPKRLLVLGGGPIGCELAQSFSRLGAEVTQLDMAPRILPREDKEISTLMTERFEAEGINVLTNHKTTAFENVDGENWCLAESDGGDVRVPFDLVLIAIGRKANVTNMGLEALNIELNPQGTVAVNEYGCTSIPTIYACGDVAGPYQFTHMASHQAWFATVNSLFGKFKKFKIDYSVVPWATFTDPEVARVGLNEADAKEQGIAVEVTRYDLAEHDRAIADGETIGFVKVLTPPGKDKILGATIVGAHGGELIGEFVLAMKHGLGLGKIMGTIHIYPTMLEANKFAAANWRKARKPEGLLNWVQKYHNWRRS